MRNPDDTDETDNGLNESAHMGGMLTSGVDVIIVLGSIDLGPTAKKTCSRSPWTSR